MYPLGDTSTINVPAFLGKLWKMVNDPSTDHLICWNSTGNSFVIQNQAQFWYELLPVYYKHNNMSSFVRQLNMYGFHKVSSVENGTMDSDRDEIIFYHPYFQKGKGELLKNIKRKVTGPKHTENTPQANYKNDDMSKVLTDVKHIRLRQSSVDSQLSAIKEENAILWGELAMLRQKHIKQQQIVNKLIHFLVTLVQPRMGGVGVKRKYPLMLRENPLKKSKDNNGKSKKRSNSLSDGPTIHELDNDLDITSGLYEEVEEQQSPMINSPPTPTFSNPKSVNSPGSSAAPTDENDSINADILWDKPDLVRPEDYLIADNEESMIDSLQHENLNAGAGVQNDPQKVFINPNSQDTLLSNLINGSYNINALLQNKTNSDGKKNVKSDRNDLNQMQAEKALAVATRDLPRISSGTKSTNVFCSDDLDFHVENTQSELDQLKDLLNGCSSLDANALLGELLKTAITRDQNLFNDDAPEYGLSCNQNKEGTNGGDAGGDPLVSGSELATYGINIDFNELFDNSMEDGKDVTVPIPPKDVNNIESINTPQIRIDAPQFPKNS